MLLAVPYLSPEYSLKAFSFQTAYSCDNFYQQGKVSKPQAKKQTCTATPRTSTFLSLSLSFWVHEDAWNNVSTFFNSLSNSFPH